jgi:YaeC family lipoprotein
MPTLVHRLIVCVASLLALAGARAVCLAADSPARAGDDRVISLIMSDAGFNAELVPLLKTEVARQGFELKWVVVNDIIQPNKLVNDAQADSNSFQHEPYFDQFVADHGLKNIVRGFYTIFTPSGLYSRKYKSLMEVPDGATFGIPVDPSNNGRALFMLQDHGLLTMRPGVSVTHASVRDIVANPHGFKFREVDQMMLTRTLDNVDVGFLFAGNAVLAGIDPRTESLALEDVATNPYKGVVAVHRSVLGTPKLEALRRAYHSEPVRAYFQKRYGDAIIFLDYLNTPASAAVPAVATNAPALVAAPEARPSLWAQLVALRPEIVKASLETLFMLVVTIPLAVLLGTPLGTLLYLTRPGSFVQAPRLYLVLNGAVNCIRSFPFLILLIAMIPVTKFIVGSALGTLGAIVPMVVNSIPYFARFVEQNLLEVNRGVIEAAESMGASRLQIIWKVLYSEARSGLAGAITILTVSFLSYSTVAGLVGGGGIGDFAIRYGYYRYQTEVMLFTIFLIVVFVQALQFGGNLVVRKLDKRI